MRWADILRSFRAYLEKYHLPIAVCWADILRALLCFLFVSAIFVSAPLRTANVVSALALRALPLSMFHRFYEAYNSNILG